MSDRIAPDRFEKLQSESCYTTEKLRNWPKDWPEKISPNRTGEFLSKIWAHFGTPNEVNFEGFSYCFRDRDLNILFSAYCASTGPAFGGTYRQYDPAQGFIVSDDLFAKLNASLEAFELLLENTVPADCEIQFETDFGIYRAGARNGIPFEEPVKKQK